MTALIRHPNAAPSRRLCRRLCHPLHHGKVQPGLAAAHIHHSGQPQQSRESATARAARRVSRMAPGRGATAVHSFVGLVENLPNHRRGDESLMTPELVCQSPADMLAGRWQSPVMGTAGDMVTHTLRSQGTPDSR